MSFSRAPCYILPFSYTLGGGGSRAAAPGGRLKGTAKWAAE